MATDTTKVVPLRRTPVKKRNFVDQAIHDITVGGAELIRIGKGAGEELQRRFRKIKDFVK